MPARVCDRSFVGWQSPTLRRRIQHCTSDVGNCATAWKAEDLLNCRLPDCHKCRGERFNGCPRGGGVTDPGQHDTPRAPPEGVFEVDDALEMAEQTKVQA